jgi:hypothetical protein
MQRAFLALALLASTLLAGCAPAADGPPYLRLLDRRAFEPAAAAPSGQPAILPHLPLAVISYGGPQEPSLAALDAAVDAAFARKRDVEFDVLAAVRPGGLPDEAMQRHAVDVAHEIAERGISTDRIHIGIAQDQGAAPRELRIYVR